MSPSLPPVPHRISLIGPWLHRLLHRASLLLLAFFPSREKLHSLLFLSFLPGHSRRISSSFRNLGRNEFSIWYACYGYGRIISYRISALAGVSRWKLDENARGKKSCCINRSLSFYAGATAGTSCFDSQVEELAGKATKEKERKFANSPTIHFRKRCRSIHRTDNLSALEIILG